MKTEQFIDTFLSGDFANKNLYSHLQAGFPQPFSYKNGLAIRYFFHKFSCDDNGIVYHAPAFVLDLIYPSGIIIKYAELQTPCKDDTVTIPKSRMMRLKYSFEECYAVCNELLDFYHSHQGVTPIVFKKYYDSLTKLSDEIGFGIWYGGLYDQTCNI